MNISLTNVPIFLDRVSNFDVLSHRMSFPDVHAIILEWHF